MNNNFIKLLIFFFISFFLLTLILIIFFQGLYSINNVNELYAPRYVFGSSKLIFLVSLVVLLISIPLAWVNTMTNFWVCRYHRRSSRTQSPDPSGRDAPGCGAGRTADAGAAARGGCAAA